MYSVNYCLFSSKVWKEQNLDSPCGFSVFVDSKAQRTDWIVLPFYLSTFDLSSSSILHCSRSVLSWMLSGVIAELSVWFGLVNCPLLAPVISGWVSYCRTQSPPRLYPNLSTKDAGVDCDINGYSHCGAHPKLPIYSTNAYMSRAAQTSYYSNGTCCLCCRREIHNAMTIVVQFQI